MGGIREEEFVVFLQVDYLLASAHLEGHEVAAYNPVIVASRRLGRDGRNEEIIACPVVISEKTRVFSFVKRSGFLSTSERVVRKAGLWECAILNQSTYSSKPNLATLSASSSAETHVSPGQGLLSLLVPLQ